MAATGTAAADPLVETAREYGLPAHEVEAIARRSAGRTCGDCTACCTVKSVRELGKPSQTACRHMCQGGCAIYERRPAGCREYACLWRQGLMESDQRLRPDQLGVIIDYEPFARMPGTVRLIVWEVVPGAAETDEVRRTVDKLLETYGQIKAVAYCAAHHPAHHDFPIDRETYPGEDASATLPIVAFDPLRGVTTYQFRKAG